jgi:hypothetical protein
MEANSARIGVIPTPPAMSSTSRRVLRRLRAEQPLLPVVLLAARGAVADGIAGLTAGGDDYVTNPSAWRTSPRGCGRCGAA